MGFWSSFLGTGAAHAINETRKETKKHNDMCYQLSYEEEQLNNYLKGVGCSAIYNADWGCLDTGSISSEVRKMESIRKKVGEYIQLGGDVRCIDFVDEIYEVEECINKVKFLKSRNILDRQVEFYRCKNVEAIESVLESERELQELEELRREKEREDELLEVVGGDINSLTGIEFEKVCQKLVENMGFSVETTKASGDGGIDLIAYNSQPLLSGKYIIQCKRYSGSVGEPIIRDLYGVVMSERANKGILMTTGYFTKSAIKFADGKPIELIDGKKIQELLSNSGINVGKSKSFFAKLLSTIGMNDFENVCIQFIGNQGFHIKDIVERDEKYILISANDKVKVFLYVCYQEKEYIDKQLIVDILEKVDKHEFDKFIIVGTCEFDNEHMVCSYGDNIDVIGVKKFIDILRNQGVLDDEGINLKQGLVSPDKLAILANVYEFMKRKYVLKVNEVEAQLAFMEVLNEAIFEAWHENKNDDVIDKMMYEYFMVEEKLEVTNRNIQYMLLYVRTNILWCKGERDTLIDEYQKLLEWEMLVNSIDYENGLQDIYLAVVYNLYQLLLVTNKIKEAKEIYKKHNKAIQYGLDYYLEEIENGKEEDDIEYVEQWQNVYDIISNGKVGEWFVLCNLDNYVISEIHKSLGYRSMIRECFENIEDTKSAEWIGLDIMVDMIDLEQREDGLFVCKKDGMEKMKFV